MIKILFSFQLCRYDGMVDMTDSKSVSFGSGGSSPPIGTTNNKLAYNPPSYRYQSAS